MKNLRKISTIFIALVTLFAMTVSVSAATDTSGTPQDAGFKYNRIMVEAEDCIVSGTDVYKKVEYTDASNTVASGGYVAQVVSNSKAASLSVKDNSAISYTFYVPEAGNYVIWLRVVEVPNSKGEFGSKQIWYALDTAENYTKTSRFVKDDNENLTWVKLTTVKATQAGEHTIKLYPHGPLLYVDKILVSNDKALTPTGDGEARASVGGKYYSTLQEAIGAATANDTITLLEDVDLGETDITLSYGTLNLNGKTLAAKSLTALNGTNVVDDNSTGKTGVLKVTTFVPAANNAQMPIYNGTGYVFIDLVDGIIKQEDGGTVSNEGVFDLIFRPSFGTAVNTSLASLGNDAQVKFVIRLEWDGRQEPLDLYYSDALVEKVYREKMAFSITASGVKNFPGLTITPLVQSTLNDGIEWLGTPYSVNQ